MSVTVTSLVKKLHLSYHSLGLSLRSKRFSLVSKQKKRGTGFSVLTAREMKREPKNERGGETLTPNPALLLAPFFVRSLALVPRSLLLNRTETGACYSGCLGLKLPSLFRLTNSGICDLTTLY